MKKKPKKKTNLYLMSVCVTFLEETSIEAKAEYKCQTLTPAV